MSGLKLHLFGPPRLEKDGIVLSINRRKPKALLAYLVLEPYGHGRETLASLFWPAYDQQRARADLSRSLSVLNKALGADWLHADRETVVLNPQFDLWVDISRFKELLEDYRKHDHPPSVVCDICRSTLVAATELYQADFLAGFTLSDAPAFDEWQLLQTEELRRALGRIVRRLGLMYSVLDDWETALEYTRRWVGLEPLHEPAHRQLMRLYAYNDQRAAALAQFEACHRILSEELNVEPAKETRALYEEIRAGTVTGLRASFIDSPKRWPIFEGEVEAPMSKVTAEAPLFVARHIQINRLDEHFAAALKGRGRVVFVTGEAGQGKTSLLSEFARRVQRAQAEVVVASGNCNAFSGIGDPYLPFRDVLSMLMGDLEARQAAGVLTQEHARRLWRLRPYAIQTLLSEGPDLIDIFVTKETLKRLTESLPSRDVKVDWLEPLQETVDPSGYDSGDLEQSQLFEQYANVLRNLAAQNPLLLLLDDLQWADSASASLLFHLGRRLSGSRILILGAYRPSEVALGRLAMDLPIQEEQHPLKQVVNEFIRYFGDIEIDLEQISPSEGRDFIDALLDIEPNRLGKSFRATLFEKTQGHPLFTIELLRDLQERGDLEWDQEQRWVEGPSLDWNTLPIRIEAVIKQRISRLETGLRDILAVASVEGEEFTVQILARVQGIGERRLFQQLSQELEKRHRLIRELGELIIGDQRLSRYRFTHLLFQQYFYNELSVGERRLLHGQIAALLEESYADHTGQFAAHLARHYAEAGEREKATGYFIEAGDQARDRYAYQAAIDHYQQALVYLESGDDFERMARTLMKLGLCHHLNLDFQQADQVYEQGFTLWQQVSESQSTSLSTPAPHPLRGHWSDPKTLDPALAGQIESESLIDQLFSGLVEHSPELGVVPAVAKNWEVLDNGSTYLFHLRDDVRWSDGKPVTAEDFEYAWKRLLDPATNAPEPSTLYDIKGARAFHQGKVSTSERVGVSALDQVTLRVELERPAGYFPHLLTLDSTYPVPRHVVEAYGQAWTKADNIVTNGPFHLQHWQPSEQLILIRNPDYHGQFSGNIDRVELSLVPDRSIPLQMYEADQLDILSHFTLRKIQTREQDRVRRRYANDLITAPGLYTNFIALDTSQPPFDDPRVRQAFVLSINRASLVAARKSNELPATGGFVPPGVPGHSPGIGQPYDPKRAQQLLASAGYPNGQGFPRIEMLAFQSHQPFCRSLQDQWRQNLGVDVDWNPLEVSRYVTRLADEGVHLCILAWMADYPDPVNFLDLNDSIEMGQWHNDRFVALIKNARLETNYQKRMKLYSQADKILMEEAAIMPLTYGHKHILVKPWVKKYPISALKFWFWKDVIIESH